MDRDLLPEVIEVLRLEDLSDIQSNTDLDVAIGEEVALGRRPATIRLWQSSLEFGLGLSRKDAVSSQAQSALHELRREGYAIAVRSTGGTAVPQGPGVFHVSYLWPRMQREATTDAYYRLLCKPIIDWLETIGQTATTGELPGSYCDGSYNILVAGKKLAGTAQAWRGGLAGVSSSRPGYILAHACITADVDYRLSTGLINRFYEMADSDYRVDEGTFTSLREMLCEDAVKERAGELSEWAISRLMRYLTWSFESLGATCRLSDEQGS